MNQRQMPMMGEARGLDPAPMELVERCRDGHQAIQLCIQLSRLPHEHIADQLSVDKGHFSRIMSGSAHFPTHKIADLMTLCGNYAPIQYWLHALGLPQPQEDERQKRIRALEDELRDLKRDDQREAG